jgi:hypothetical protein
VIAGVTLYLASPGRDLDHVQARSLSEAEVRRRRMNGTRRERTPLSWIGGFWLSSGSRRRAFRDFRKLGPRSRAQVSVKARLGEPIADPLTAQIAVAWAREVIERRPRGWLCPAGTASGFLIFGEWFDDTTAICSGVVLSWFAGGGWALKSVARNVLRANAADGSAPDARLMPREIRRAMWTQRRYLPLTVTTTVLLTAGAFAGVFFWAQGLPLLALGLLCWIHLAEKVSTGATDRTPDRSEVKETVVSLSIAAGVCLAVLAVLLAVTHAARDRAAPTSPTGRHHCPLARMDTPAGPGGDGLPKLVPD